MTNETLFCCHPNCLADAEFHLTFGPMPDDYTHACADHVGHLVATEPFTVTPLNPVKE